jgi:hypothetical protein
VNEPDARFAGGAIDHYTDGSGSNADRRRSVDVRPMPSPSAPHRALSDRVNTFGQYLLKRYGQRVHKLALNAGFHLSEP